MIDRGLVGKLIDAAVNDPDEAAALIRRYPALRTARYILGETPLHFCAVEYFPGGVNVLASLGIDVNEPNQFGDTALIDVVRIGNDEMAKLLLQLGADPNIPSPIHGSPLHIAASANRIELAKTIKEAGAELPHICVQEYSIETVECMASLGADVNGRNKYGETPLIEAIRGFEEKLVKVLLRLGAAIDVPNELGETPLVAAVDNGDLEMVEFFLSLGASPNPQPPSGASPLNAAVFNGNTAIIQALVKAGADPFLRDGKGLQAIDLLPPGEIVRKEILRALGNNAGPEENAEESSATNRRSRTLS